MIHVVFSKLPNDFVTVVNKHTFCYKPYASVKSCKEGPTLEYYEKLTTKFISGIYKTVP